MVVKMALIVCIVMDGKNSNFTKIILNKINVKKKNVNLKIFVPFTTKVIKIKLKKIKIVFFIAKKFK